MKVSARSFVILIFLAGAALIVIPSVLLTMMINREDFRDFTEARVSEVLQAQVRIKGMKLGFLNQVDLSGFEMAGPQKKNGYRVEVDKIVFRYDWFQLFKRRAENPAVIVLKSPRLTLGEGGFPYDLLGSFLPKRGFSLKLPQMELQGGSLRFRIPSFQEEIAADPIHARLRGLSGGRIQMDGTAKLQGLLSGQVHVVGVIDPRERSHRLELDLSEVRLSDKIPLPFEALSGRVRWEGDRFYLEPLQGRIFGWAVKIQGSFRDPVGRPEAVLDFFVPSRKGEEQILQAGLREGKLEVLARPQGPHPVPVTGIVELQSGLARISKMVVNRQYEGEILIDYSHQELYAHFEKPLTTRRWDFKTHLRRLDTEIRTKLEHYEFSGLDITTELSVKLKPVFLGNAGRLWKIAGQFETGYFLLEYTPLEDFQGTFDLSPSGVQNFQASWGKSFQLNGQGDFEDGRFVGEVQIGIRNYDVANVEQLAGKPLPKKLGGIMNGSVDLKGAFPAPVVSGNVTIKDGCLGHLEYDLAVVHLAGVPPLIYLKDSKVYRGRTKLDLMGSVNLTLPNILSDIRYQQPDNLIAWKAFQWEAAQGDIEVKKRGPDLPGLVLKVGAGDGMVTQGEQETDRQSKEKYIAVGPKIKF